MPRFVRTLRFQVSVALLVAAALCAFAAGRYSGSELAASYHEGADRLLASATKSFAAGFSRLRAALAAAS